MHADTSVMATQIFTRSYKAILVQAHKDAEKSYVIKIWIQDFGSLTVL